MDIFRRLLDKRTGKGGVKCSCCNKGYRGKDRKKLRRLARHIMKRQREKEVFQVPREQEALEYWERDTTWKEHEYQSLLSNIEKERT